MSLLPPPPLTKMTYLLLNTTGKIVSQFGVLHPTTTQSDDFSFMESLCKTKSYTTQSCWYCASNHLVLICVLYIEVYVIDKPWCEHEPNQTMDYAVNPRLITSTTTVKSLL